MKKSLVAFLMTFAILLTSFGIENTAFVSNAQGASYFQLEDTYYTKANCVVYAEPTYTATVLTTIGANVPVKVLGYYSNGWYRINIGVICYVKMDSLTTAGAIGAASDAQTADAQKAAKEMGYSFVALTLNKEKVIKKDIYNSYLGQKVVLFAKIDDELAVSFKMLYNDKVKKDIDLNYTKTWAIGNTGERIVSFTLNDPTELMGQIAIFQFKEGYDKAVTIFPVDLSDGTYVEMNTYYTEDSEFAYAPVTQVANMMISEDEVAFSLTNNLRTICSDHRKGIKYMIDDTKDYRSSITSKLRKDTEYVDYTYK